MAENKVQMNEGLLRATNTKRAVEQASIAQGEQTVAAWKKVELHPALERTHNQRRASLLSATEQKEQIEAPRTPTTHHVDQMSTLVTAVSQHGSRRRASVEIEHEQVARTQKHIFETECAPSIRRAVACKEADASMEVEQAQRVAHNHMSTEVSTEIIRAVAVVEAVKKMNQEQAEQIESPRRPSGYHIAQMSDVVQSMDQLGARRRASTAIAHEQVARTQQHLMATEVAPSIRRKVSARAADAAADLEQHQRVTKHHVSTEVGTELIRTVAGMEADKAMDAEQSEQLETARRPSQLIVAAMSEVVESVHTAGNRKLSAAESQKEQLALVQQHLMETQVAESIRRAVGCKQVDALVQLEQAQRSTQHLMETEVNDELRRVVARKAAATLTTLEHCEQIAEPRRPSGCHIAQMSTVVTSVDQLGSQRRASVVVDIEQAQRIVQHLFSCEVGEQLRRKVAAGAADGAMDVEKAQRATQDYIANEVNRELVRTVSIKRVVRETALELAAQTAEPRRPSGYHIIQMSNVVQSVDAIGRRRRASVEMDHEKVTRIQRHIMSSEVGTELRRSVNARAADGAMDLEKAQRVIRHWVETEINTQLRRRHSTKRAAAEVAAEQSEQIAQPRRPSNEVRAAKSAINAAIDVYNIPAGFVMVNPENDAHSG